MKEISILDIRNAFHKKEFHYIYDEIRNDRGKKPLFGYEYKIKQLVRTK